MLVQFRVENHRSLRDEQVLSMVAASSASKDDDRLIRPEGLGEALLPAVALYGANASGKSNVLGAMGFDLRRTGDVTPLLGVPLWVPAFAIALACAVECLVLAATAAGENGGAR